MCVSCALVLVGRAGRLLCFPLLLQVYVQVNREAEGDESVRSAAAGFYRRLVQREDQALALWTQFREITVLEYKRIYQVTSS